MGPPVWTASRRIMVSLPIFIILIGLLTTVSRLTAVPWKNEPVDQTLATLSADTAINFANPKHEPLPNRGSYQVSGRHASFTAKQPATGATQQIRMLVREPRDAPGRHPAVVFMHGAGLGTSDDSFGDVAADLTSAGFVTVVMDKPRWHTNDLTRDYIASAQAYDQAADYLRGLPDVNPDKVGLYATSESTWISAHLLQRDHRIAFQILLSPMVYSPRQAMGFLAAQDFAVVGANPGYQAIVRRVFNVDFDRFGLHNSDFQADPPRAYAVPTLVAYGSKDVMTAQVDGARKILALAHDAGNWDVTFRSYTVANHVLRLGDEAQSGTPLADHYRDDMVSWAVGQVAGLRQTSVRMAGPAIYQSIAVPLELKAHPTLTWYMVVLHLLTLLAMLAAGVMALIALVSTIRHALHHSGPALGFTHGFGGVLLVLTVTTLSTVVLFLAGFAQVIVDVVKLAWGAAPEPAGVIYWSWPVTQVVCTVVVWAWSRVISRMLEVASLRGLTHMPPTQRSVGQWFRSALHIGDREPVIAATSLGRVLFGIVSAAMFLVLLVFAFWGLFIY